MIIFSNVRNTILRTMLNEGITDSFVESPTSTHEVRKWRVLQEASDAKKWLDEWAKDHGLEFVGVKESYSHKDEILVRWELRYFGMFVM